jgi:AraC-like DNA-binding protein
MNRTSQTTSAAWVAGIVRMLESQGIDVPALFAELEMDIDTLGQVDARFPTESVSALWQRAALRSGNPGIGLCAPRTAQLASFEVLGYAMMSCPNLLAGLERLVRYLRIVSEAAQLRLGQAGGESRLDLMLYGGEQPVPSQRYEFDLLIFIGFCRWLSGREIHPRCVELAQPAPADLRPYAEAFQCPLRFDAPGYCVLFDSADLLRPLPTSNPMLAELHDRLLGEGLERLGDTRITHRAREEITRRLPEGEPRREDVAGALCLSERTLQRRLQDEGTSFQQLLDGTRRELAQQYLKQRKASLAQIAYLLGFSDQSIFHRACKRWFNASPGKYRAVGAAMPGRMPAAAG